MHVGNFVRKTVSLLLTFLLTAEHALVSGLRCNSCEKSITNDDCNANVAECSNSNHDACFTQIEKIEGIGKRYTKGCINSVECDKIEQLNKRKYCKFAPSDCTYCCKNKSYCNANNLAPTVAAAQISKTLLVAMAAILLATAWDS